MVFRPWSIHSTSAIDVIIISLFAGSENGGDSDIIVRLGLDSDGVQKTLSAEFNHISVWCEEFKIDFGNAALVCPPPQA